MPAVEFLVEYGYHGVSPCLGSLDNALSLIAQSGLDSLVSLKSSPRDACVSENIPTRIAKPSS